MESRPETLEPASNTPPARPAREPVFNVPGPLIAIVAALLAVHLGLTLAPMGVLHAAIVHGAFIPARLVGPDGGWEAVTMWLTHAGLHGSWGHVGMNSVWLVIFGTPVLRRIGLTRFAALCAAGAVGAMGLHLVAYWSSAQPVIGASGVVSALAGAAVRFAFSPATRHDPRAAPRLSVVGALTSRATLPFIAVWMVANALFGAGLLGPGGPAIAWEAHAGGFLTGLVAFAAFDRPPDQAKASAPDSIRR